MSYPAGEHNSFLIGEAPSLEVSQARLQAALPLPREIISAYGPALTRAYALGDPGFDRKEANDLQWWVSKSVDELTISTSALIQTAEPAGSLSFFLAAPNLEVYTEIYRNTQQSSIDGINAHGVQAHLYSLEHIFYYGQSPEPAYDTVQGSGILRLTADATNQTYERLVEQGLIDTSARRLSRRFGIMERTAQLAMIELLARDLDIVRIINEKWHDIAKLTLRTLLEIDGKPPTIYNRLDAVKRIGSELQEHGENEEHPIIKQAIGNIVTHAAVIASSVDRRMDYFATIYDAFRYKPPFSKLLEESQGSGHLRPAETPAKAVSEAEKQRELDLKAEQEQRKFEQRVAAERRLQEILAGAPLYRNFIEAFNKPWSITNKEFKNGGYEFIRQALTGNHGKFLPTPETTFTKTDARYIIGFIAQLKGMFSGGTLEPIGRFLEHSCREERSRANEIRDINNILRRYKPDTEPLEPLRKLTAYTQTLAKSWQLFEPMIRELWPQNGADLAEKLQALFTLVHPEFTQTSSPAGNELLVSEEPEATNDADKAEAQAKEDLEELIAQAEELDLVVFPDKPTDKEIMRVLGGHGIKAGSLTPKRLERLRDFLRLREVTDNCKFYVSRTGVKRSRRQYFVLRFTIEGKQYALAESLEPGRASYALAEHLAEGTIIELLKSYKEEARALGARQINHEPDDTRHHEKLLNAVLTMHEETKGQADAH
ncbi:MAG TPA: hypothetical protein VLG16_02740 [Candidatus Saccharimonadales bacterium]|nr:hypothetical protein [Candidatus Saccharimonadales bacterium]